MPLPKKKIRPPENQEKPAVVPRIAGFPQNEPTSRADEGGMTASWPPPPPPEDDVEPGIFLMPEPDSGETVPVPIFSGEMMPSPALEEHPKPPRLPADGGEFGDAPDDAAPDCPPTLPPPQREDHALVAEVVDKDIKDAKNPSSPLERSHAAQATPQMKPANSSATPSAGKAVGQSAEISSSPSASSANAREDDLKIAEFLAKTRGVPPELKSLAVKNFLKQYGYDATNDSLWPKKSGLPQPELTITVANHIEFGDHTQYEFQCHVKPREGSDSAATSWRTLRRLKHLRSGIHAPVKKVLGSKYKQYFNDTPFALHTAPKGTSARLKAWFSSLARCINAGDLEPAVVAATFRILDGPGTPLYAEGKFQFCLSSDFEQIPITAAMFGAKHSVLQVPSSIDSTVHTPRAGGAAGTSQNRGQHSGTGYRDARPAGHSDNQASSASSSGPQTATEWLLDQGQFAHLSVLPQGWIRVRSRTTREIYYCCVETGETTFEEPTAQQACSTGYDLPPGWVPMRSRTTGLIYFWNRITQVSQFERPGEEPEGQGEEDFEGKAEDDHSDGEGQDHSR